MQSVTILNVQMQISQGISLNEKNAMHRCSLSTSCTRTNCRKEIPFPQSLPAAILLSNTSLKVIYNLTNIHLFN